MTENTPAETGAPPETPAPPVEDAPEAPAMDDDVSDPDNMVGDITTSDVDLSRLVVEPDKDGGDSDE